MSFSSGLPYDADIDHLRNLAMIKGIVLCFAFLFAQLVVLHHIDSRLNGNAHDARQVVSAPPPSAQRDDEEKDRDTRS